MAGVPKGSGKVRRIERFRFLVCDPTDAETELAEARLAQMRARGEQEHEEASQRLRDATAAVDACFGTVTLRALAPQVHELFVQELAERQQQQQEASTDDAAARQWTADSLDVRFLAACDVEHDADWWAAEFAGDEWTLHEREELLEACFRLNTPRRFDLSSLGKG